MSTEPTTLGPDWWTSLTHSGLLLAPQMVKQFSNHEIGNLSASKTESLRRAVTRRKEESIYSLLDDVFLGFLGYDERAWNRNPPAVDWSRRLVTGDTARPDRLITAPDGTVFPMFTEEAEIRLGLGRGRRLVARVIEWLRKSDLKIALLSTREQWRLIYAGFDFEASCEWNLNLWFEAGHPSLQVEALRRLLPPEHVPAKLLGAIQDSRRGQAELTSQLGEYVRQGVEKLIQSAAPNLDKPDLPPSHIYVAAVRIIMRLVVALFAEGKDMLGRDLPVYHDSYGVQGLRSQLEQISQSRSASFLNGTQFAWPRLIALFRLIYYGSTYPDLAVVRYGGVLFEPGDPNSSDPVLRAIAALENTHPCPRDRDVFEILNLLTRTGVKVSQHGGAKVVAMPVDFSALDTEYIGILYEGLLDYDLKKETEVVVFVRMGNEPALKLSELEAIPPAKLKDIFGKLKKKGSEDDEDDGGEQPENGETSEDDATDTPEAEIEADVAPDLTADETSMARAHQWAVTAVKAAGIVRAPRSQTAKAKGQYDADVELQAKNLFSRIVRPGDWYLVRFGNTRKGSGTFYTRKELAGPTVRRTLQPLVYLSPGVPRKPEEILALKICDPAVGSGSFLISALRYLTDVLFESLYHHNRIQEHSESGNTSYDLGLGEREHSPTGDDFNDRLKARLRRFVVERCLYGVDINPLAIELARMSLWIETLDARLPFGFLDHKLRPGNSLVGCWFDRFEDYPVMAWMREGGDKDLTKALSKEVQTRIKPGLIRLIDTARQQINLTFVDGRTPSEIRNEARRNLEEIHGLNDPDEQREKFRALRGDPAFRQLQQAFDTWCALWFWPGDALRQAPSPGDFSTPSDETAATVTNLCEHFRFFHWELEFPDVFRTENSGFNAVLGNPPWEVQKPNSKEFFSNIDPLYRTYGKDVALTHQKEYFARDSQHEHAWIAERARLKALSNWVKFAAIPFGDRITDDAQGRPTVDFPLGVFKISSKLHDRWKSLRQHRGHYADRQHPFQHQGTADLNTYKMFLEAGYRLLRNDGRLGVIIPSGIYSDQGCTALRTLFLDHSRWEWLFSFENREQIFAIHRSFKFNPIIVQKGGKTEVIHTAFMRHSLKDWEEAEKYALDYPAEQVGQFSPESKAVLEIRSQQDLQILEKLYSNGVLLGDPSEKGWGIQYATEFHMTNDHKLFPPRPEWEAKGYRSDEYGHWLLGNWQAYSGPKSILEREKDLVLSADGMSAIRTTEIENVALPLYEGRMIGQFDFSEKGWVSGKGRSAVWEGITSTPKSLHPQFLMSTNDYAAQKNREGGPKAMRGLKVAFMDVTAATNARTMISTVVSDRPCGNSAPVLSSADPFVTCSVLNSFSYDFVARLRCAGLHLNYFVIEDSCLPKLIHSQVSLK